MSRYAYCRKHSRIKKDGWHQLEYTLSEGVGLYPERCDLCDRFHQPKSEQIRIVFPGDTIQLSITENYEENEPLIQQSILDDKSPL